MGSGFDPVPFVVIPFAFTFGMQSEARNTLKYRLRKTLRERTQVPVQTKLIYIINL